MNENRLLVALTALAAVGLVLVTLMACGVDVIGIVEKALR